MKTYTSNVFLSYVIHICYLLSGLEKIVCTFEEETCLLDDDLALKERWIKTKSTVSKWDNTLNIGVYLIVHY